MSRMVIRPRIQIPIVVVIFTVWALLGVTYFTSRDVVAERDWFGIVLGCVLVTSGVAGIWRAVRLGVVIDAEGVRVRGFDSRDQVTPWSAIQSVDCAQIDVRGGLPLYAPVLRLVDDAPAMPLSFRGTEVDPFLSHHAGAASKRSFRDGVVSRRSRSWNQCAAAGWTAGHEESGKALVRD